MKFGDVDLFSKIGIQVIELRLQVESTLDVFIFRDPIQRVSSAVRLDVLPIVFSQ